jgi:tetratricopeptide (TPR) repeat protein
MLRALGLLFAVAYGALIVWLYAAQPQTVAQMTGGLAAEIGVYRVNQQAFDDGLRFFRKDQFEEARAAFARADPAQRDALTRFYIAYSYYRQGWGRVYNDDELFKKGLQAVDQAISLAPEHRLVVEDTNLGMKSADELRA